MSEWTSTRRGFVASLGLAALPLAGCGGVESDWIPVDGPTDATLADLVATREGTYAVGEGGVVVRRGDERWSVVLEDGPAGEQNGLRSTDVTSNGRVAWFCGDSGALGLYDTVTGHVADFSAPLEKTSSWEAVAVAGLAGSERIFLVNGSSEFLRGTRDGADVAWSDPTKPGTGSSVTALDVTPLEYAYFCDTNGGVYESPDAGESWERIGIREASVNFDDVAAVDSGHVSVAGGNGVVYRYDGVGWSRTTVGEDPIRALARDRYDALAVTATGGIYERTFEGWAPLDAVDLGNELLAIALGTPHAPQVAVGQSGTILERRY